MSLFCLDLGTNILSSSNSKRSCKTLPFFPTWALKDSAALEARSSMLPWAKDRKPRHTRKTKVFMAKRNYAKLAVVSLPTEYTVCIVRTRTFSSNVTTRAVTFSSNVTTKAVTFSSNASIFVHFGYDWCFILSLFSHKFNKLSIKYQSYPNSTKIDLFEQNACLVRTQIYNKMYAYITTL